MTENEFTLVYDGGTVVNATVDALEFGQSVVSLSQLAQQAALAACPEQPDIELRVKAGLRQGSFEVDFALFFQKAVSLFTSQQAAAIANISTILGLSGFGLFQLLKRSKGQKEREAVKVHGGNVKIVFGDDHSVIVPEPTYDLYRNGIARRAVQRVIAPLKSTPNSKLKLLTPRSREPVFETTSEEASFFDPPSIREEALESQTEQFFKINTLSFVKGNKWRLSDGSKSYFVQIDDEDFVDRFTEGEEAFASEDIIHAELITRQWYENGNLRIERVIPRVLKHIRPSATEEFNLNTSGKED
jgi:hypothetical protein